MAVSDDVDAAQAPRGLPTKGSNRQSLAALDPRESIRRVRTRHLAQSGLSVGASQPGSVPPARSAQLLRHMSCRWCRLAVIWSSSYRGRYTSARWSMCSTKTARASSSMRMSTR